MADPRHTSDMRRLTGRRIRRRRLFLEMSQTALAKTLGVSYQQVQKYEKGLNRLPETRLRQIAHVLEVSPGYFSSLGGPQADDLESFVESADGVALNRAVAGLLPAQRARLIMAVGAWCDSHTSPERNDDDVLRSWLRSTTAGRDSDIAGEVEESLHAAKVELAKLLGKTLRARRMTQVFAARILGANQARISTLARGDVREVSLEKLLRYLLLLGWNPAIALVTGPADGKAKIEITVRNA